MNVIPNPDTVKWVRWKWAQAGPSGSKHYLAGVDNGHEVEISKDTYEKLTTLFKRKLTESSAYNPPQEVPFGGG